MVGSSGVCGNWITEDADDTPISEMFIVPLVAGGVMGPNCSIEEADGMCIVESDLCAL